MEPISSLLINILAAIIYDAYKNRARKFNDYLNKAFSDTCTYFLKRENNPVELNQDQFRKVLLGEELCTEIDKLGNGFSNIDTDRLALFIATFGDIYLEEETKILPLAKEILNYFIKKLEEYLLADKHYALSIIKSYIVISSNENLKKSDEIIASLKQFETKINQIDEKIDTLLEITPKKNEIVHETTEIIETLFKKYLGTQNTQLSSALTDPETPSKSYNSELNEIKELVEKEKNTLAREKAFVLLPKINQDQNKEEIFLLNSYIAQTYLNSYDDQKKAIEYLHKAIDYCSKKEIIHRHKAIIYLIEQNYKDGLSEIDNAISIEPKNEKNINIKINLLLNLNDLDKAFKLIPVGTNELNFIFLKAWLYFRSKNYDQAVKSALKAIEIDPNHYDSRILYGDIIIQKHDKEIYNDSVKTEVQYQDSKEALKHLNIAFSLLNIDQGDKISYVSYQIGLISLWVPDFQNAKKYFEIAVKHKPHNTIYLRNLGFIYLALNENTSAINCFKKIKSIDPSYESEIDLLCYETHLNNGNPDYVINEIENIIDWNHPENFDIRYYSVLSRAYDRKLETTKAEKIFGIIVKHFSSSPEFVYLKANHFILTGNDKEAIDLIEQFIPVTQGKYKRLLQNMLGDLYYNNDEFDKALELYRNDLNKNILSSNLKKVAYCLYSLKKFSECLSLCIEIRQIHGVQLPFFEYEGAIYFNLENFENASKIFRELSINQPNIINYKLKYGLCIYRLGKFDEAVDVFRQAEFSNDLTPYELIALSQAYLHVGSYEKSLEISYRALEKDNTIPQTHTNFIFNCIKVEGFIENFEERYSKKCRDCIELFESRFPEEKTFQKVIIAADGEKISENFKEMIREASEFSDYIEQIYITKKLPICFLAKALNKNIIQIWSAVTSFKHLNIIVSSGTYEHRNEEYINCNSSENIIIDIISLLTLDHLHILNIVPKYFKKIYICQSTIDTIQELISIEELSLNKGHFSSYYKNGSYFYEEADENTPKGIIDKLSNLLKIIHDSNSFEIIGKTLNREKKLNKEQNEYIDQFKKTFPSYIIDIILEGHSRNINLFLEEFPLRVVCKGIFKINSFETQSLLNCLIKIGLIDENNYQDSLLKLLNLNYTFVSISEKTLIRAVESHFFNKDHISLIPFNSIKQKENNIMPLIDISIKFLKWLWLDNIDVINKVNWTNILLESLTFKRDKQRIINTIIKRKNEIFSPLALHVEQYFLKVIKDWKKLHLLA